MVIRLNPDPTCNAVKKQGQAGHIQRWIEIDAVRIKDKQ